MGKNRQSDGVDSLTLLVGDLRRVVTVGWWLPGKLTAVPTLVNLSCLSDLAPSADPLDRALGIHHLLDLAVGRLGESSSGKSARSLFGLTSATRGQLVKHRIKRAADLYGVKPETFRKIPLQRLLEEIAAEIYRIDREYQRDSGRMGAGAIFEAALSPPRPPEAAPQKRRPGRIRSSQGADLAVRPVEEHDRELVTRTAEWAFASHYDGDQRSHAARLFDRSMEAASGVDPLASPAGAFFVVEDRGKPVGLLRLVAKPQGTLKLGPLIVQPQYSHVGVLEALLGFIEAEARERHLRHVYATVTAGDLSSIRAFKASGYVEAGRGHNAYKDGVDEVFLYRPLLALAVQDRLDRANLSVLPLTDLQEVEARDLISDALGPTLPFMAKKVAALFDDYLAKLPSVPVDNGTLIYCAVDRYNHIYGVVVVVLKSDHHAKFWPLAATTLPAFLALVTDVPFALRPNARRVYLLLEPTVEQVVALHQRGWVIDAVLPGALVGSSVTQRWSLELSGDQFLRDIRVKQQFLRAIRNGAKDLEIRVAYPTIATIRPGERIRFISHSDSTIRRVKAVRRYQNFESLLGHEDPTRIIPGADSQQVLRILREIYPPERETLGAVVIELDGEASEKGGAGDQESDQHLQSV